MDRMCNELTVKEIDQIISFLQDPHPYELIKRLEALKEETIFWNRMRGERLLAVIDEENQIRKQGGFGTSPVSSAYFKIEQVKDEI